jgi:hypothetical protein
MITPELQAYIRQQLGTGTTKEVIKQNLFTQGWNEQDLSEAFLAVENVQFPKAFFPPLQQSIKPKGHKGKWAIIVLVFLLVGSGSAYAAYHYGLFNKIFTQNITMPPVVTTTLPKSDISPVVAETIPAKLTATQLCPSIKRLDDNIIIHAKVIFPKGIHLRDYTTTTGESLDSNNSFCTQGSKGRLVNLLLLSNTDENSLAIGATVYSQNDITNLIIDSKSIAILYVIQALVIPIGSENMMKVPNFIQEVSDNPAVIAFANGIAAANSLTFADIDTGGSLNALYIDAQKAVIVSYSTKYLYH